jgi:peptidoglycan/xylan/chitin deacetylase (PgdA/CDA1 family)
VGGVDVFLSLVLDVEAAAPAGDWSAGMIPCPAQYLLRFDDLCPTHARERWMRFPPLLAKFGIRPILAIVPDNRDPELAVSAPDPEFWEEMRTLQAAGAAIGLHGFRHLCASRGRSLVPLHGVSEFAGAPEAIQRQWIREGLEILRGHRLDPILWVAPRHGFDCATLRALREEGIGLLSDGFARRPFIRGGLRWIPQQLWAPEQKASGLWTICLHPNTATDAEVERLRDFLREYAGQFTSVERVAAEMEPARLRLAERIGAEGAVLSFRARRVLKRFVGERLNKVALWSSQSLGG